MKPTVLITSGPTREFIDPVRFLSNTSSGTMGRELARAARRQGCRVIVVSGPAAVPPPAGVTVIPVVSAREMFAQVKRNAPSADIVIGAAAVADYRPRRVERHKIKKGATVMRLELVKNPDIIGYVGRRKKGAVTVGFALESRCLARRARGKLRRKRLDLVVANGPEAAGARSATVRILARSGNDIVLRKASKRTIAERIINEALRLWKDRQTGTAVR